MSYGWAKDADTHAQRRMPRWIDLGLPCPVCAVDIGEHLHSLVDGELGVLIITPDQYDAFGASTWAVRDPSDESESPDSGAPEQGKRTES